MVTADESQAKRLRAISAQARSGAEYRYDEIGFNYRMTNLNAGVLLAQIERMEEMVATKRRIAAAYDRAVAGRNDLQPMPRTPWGESACWLYSVRCRGEAEARDLVQHMAEHDIEARIFWRTLSDQAPYAYAPRRLTGVAAKLSGTVVSLPCSSSLTDEQQARVIAALAKWPHKSGR